jgi:conjugative relaxase-like TrwC/TraI family protein
MLSLWKLRVGVENYYIGQVAEGLEDYYTGHGEMPGRWLGAAASGLGLEFDPVDSSDLQAVLAGLAPGTGLTPNGDQLRPFTGRVPGFDLTFAAPKSVSVLYALGDPLVRSHVIEAADRAVDEAVAWLEREACFVRRGSNNRASARGDSAGFGTRRLRAAGFVAAAFRHRTSRASDPHLHTHVLVANITRGPDGRWSALDGQALYRSKVAAGVVYQTVLRDELSTRLGVTWGPVHNHTADVAGIPRRVLRLFSKRRNEIRDELERVGADGPAAADAAMLATRTTKTHGDGQSLYDRWAAEAATIGYGPADIDQLLAGNNITIDPGTAITRPAGETPSEDRLWTAGQLAGQVADRLIEHDSTFTRHDATTAIADLLADGCTVRTVERLTNWVLAQPDLVPLPASDHADAGWEQRWTSRRLLAIEDELLAHYQPIPGSGAAVDPRLVENVIGRSTTLGGDQADTVRRVTTQGLGVEVVVGRAGTGKTYTMNTVRSVFAAAGYRTIGVASTARAARELGDGARIPTSTIARLQWHDHRFGPRQVVIVDEAGMTGTFDLHWIISRARAAGAKVILVGDHHQLPEITAGGGFAAAVTTLGDSVAELTVNRRQTAQWEHAALEQLRALNVHIAFNTYRAHGRVVLADTAEQIHAAAVQAWNRDHRNGDHALLLAGTRNETAALNQHARRHAADLLTGPVLQLGDRDFQAGDRILLLRNGIGQLDLDTGENCRVDNGMIGAITRINTRWRRAETDSIDLRLDNGRNLRLTADYVRAGHIDHGYAATVHKAQGVTCDRVHVVGPAGLYREAGYVAMSRARHGAWLYATSRQAVDINEHGHARSGIPTPGDPDPDPELDIITTLHTSKAKQLATLQGDHLADVADLATATPLDVLETRARHIRTTIADLEHHGYLNPTVEADRLARAVDHRPTMHVGGRVKALDWDNVGTVQAIFDRTGTARVEFHTSDRHYHAVKTLPWADLKPIDHPDPAELGDDSRDWIRLATQAVTETRQEWDQQLTQRDIHPDDTIVVPAAVETRRSRVAHALRADPPEWLTWWLGQRPADPVGAQVWDDELARLAAWRDHQHLDDTPGYGPQPDQPDQARQWREHLDRSLTTRIWLTNHQPRLDNVAPAPLDVVAVRQRLDELDAILDSAPPDQRRIIDAIHTGELTPDDINTALTRAAHTQTARRAWIIENWPHVIEHAELTRLDAGHDPLAHWPQPLTPTQQDLYQQLVAVSSDTPEHRTLPALDAELCQADPRHRLAAIERRLGDIHGITSQLEHDLHGAAPDHAEILHYTLGRLVEQLADLEHERQQATAITTMWDTGYRPGELVDAINRRTTHLAHTALTRHDPWIDTTIRQWTHHQPDPATYPAMHELHRIIHHIAAWRERTGHTGPDPLGPEPSDPILRQRWVRLHSHIAEPPEPDISRLLER